MSIHFTYRQQRAKKSAPVKVSRRKEAASQKATLSGFQGTDLYQDTDLASVLGSVTPSRRGQG